MESELITGTCTIQILDIDSDAVAMHTIDVQECSTTKIVSDARREFDIKPSEFVYLVGPKGEVLYNEYKALFGDGDDQTNDNLYVEMMKESLNVGD